MTQSGIQKYYVWIENIFDMISRSEESGEYKGQYYVLQGLLSLSKGIKPEDLKIDRLLKKVKKK